MPRVVLITGTHTLLAAALAARYRADTDDLVLVHAPENMDVVAGRRVDVVWWLYGGPGDAALVKCLLAALPVLGAQTCNLVGPAPPELERETAGRCAACAVRSAVFHVPHLLSQEVPTNAAGHGEVFHFLDVLDALVVHVEERLPEYFRLQPLRCLARAGATVDLAGADDVARVLLSITQTADSGQAHQLVATPVPLADLCARVGPAWNLDLAVVADGRTLNAVDRAFRDRLLSSRQVDPAPANLPGAVMHRVSDLDEPTLRTLLRAFRQGRAQARATDRARVAALADSLEPRTVSGSPGLTYHAAGRAGPCVIAVNAIGQGRAVWLPLLERLSRRRRVIVWEMRQADADGRPVTFAEHCQDLHAVLRHEGASGAHLLGWCTGAKLATWYGRTHPGAVQSMVFLSGSFKHPGRAPELDTPYERNLEAMCRAIVLQPSTAERLRPLFAPTAPGGRSKLDQMDGDQLALHALTALPPDLGLEVRRPFRDASTLNVYAQQHTEFWSHDETTTAHTVAVPVLGIAGEYDQVVSPAGFQAALSHFPAAHYVEVAGTGHYAFYDRADLVADLVEDFIGRASSHTRAQFWAYSQLARG